MRFKKSKDVLHLQIKQAALQPMGTIAKNSEEWKPVGDYSISDSGIGRDVHYHTLTWDSRAIVLDDIVGEPDHLVTGVKFEQSGGFVRLTLRITPFDFESGLLVGESSTWLRGPRETSELR